MSKAFRWLIPILTAAMLATLAFVAGCKAA